MKKIANYLFILAILAGITACGNNADTQSGPDVLTWQEQYDLGIHYLSEGNYEEAIIAFTAAIEIEPKRAEAYVGRGNAYVLSGETEENLTAAQVDYEMAINLDETLEVAYLGLADVYIRRGEYEKAQEVLERGINTVRDTKTLEELYEEIKLFGNGQWRADLSESEKRQMQDLLSAFESDDAETIKTLIRSDMLWNIIQEYGLSSNNPNHFKFDYGNTVEGFGLYIDVYFSQSTERSISCYFGNWVKGKLNGKGIMCRYWLPPSSDEWAGTEDWTITHTSFIDGLADGDCERVRWHPVRSYGPDNSCEQYDCITVVSGAVSKGLWNGYVKEVQTYSNGEIYAVEGTFQNGIILPTGSSRGRVCYGKDADTGELCDIGPDGCWYVDFMEYWDICDPVRGTRSTAEDEQAVERYRNAYQIASLSYQENADEIYLTR